MRNAPPTLLLTLFFALSAAAAEKPADGEKEKSDEEVLQELEKQPTKPGAPAPSAIGRFIQSLNPDISVIGTVTAAYFNDRALESGNAVPQGETDPKKTGFLLQELEVSFQAAVDPYFRMDAFLSIGMEGLEIEEAYFSTLALPGGLQLRAGLMNLKFGRQNQRHLHTWEFVDNYLPIARLLGQDAFRTVGLETSWLLPIPWFAELSLMIGQPTGPNTRAFVGEGVRDEAFHLHDPGDLLYVFHLAQHFDLATDWGLSVGLSYALGPNGSGGNPSNHTHLFGADLFLKWRPLRSPYTEIRFTSEWYGRLIDHPDARTFDWGFYAQLAVRLSKRWFLAFRYDMVEIDDPRRLVANGFDTPGTDLAAPVPLDDQNRASLSLTWQPTEFSQIRVQYNNDWIKRTAGDGTGGKYGQVHSVFVQFQGNIGTHGAHPY